MDFTHDKVSGRWTAGYGVDTLLVLFFLTIEFGRSVELFSIEGTLSAMTIAMVAALPYFLPSSSMVPLFGKWLGVRLVVAAGGLIIGLGLRLNGGGLTGQGSSLPMTMLILAGMASCYIQFYGLMKLRLAK